MTKDDIDVSNIVDLLRNRVAVDSDYYYNQLPRDIRQLAFTVSGLEKLREIEMVKRSLENAIDQGMSFKEWRDNVNIPGLRALSNQRLETVYRMNINSVYNQSARYNAWESDVTPYLMYTAIGDDRTRPSHMALDGTVKRADSEFWDKFTPPWDWNCRCGVVPIDKETAQEIGISRRSNFANDTRFRSKKMGDVLSGVTKEAEQAIKDLPRGSPFREKFKEQYSNIKNLVDIWFNKNKDIFTA